MIGLCRQRQQRRVAQRLADEVRGRPTGPHDTIETDQHDEPMADLERLIEAREVIRVQRYYDNTQKVAVDADDLAGELHGITVGHPAQSTGFADEQPVLRRVQMHAEMFAIAEVHGLLAAVPDCSAPASRFGSMIEICRVCSFRNGRSRAQLFRSNRPGSRAYEFFYEQQHLVDRGDRADDVLLERPREIAGVLHRFRSSAVFRSCRSCSTTAPQISNRTPTIRAIALPRRQSIDGYLSRHGLRTPGPAGSRKAASVIEWPKYRQPPGRSDSRHRAASPPPLGFDPLGDHRQPQFARQGEGGANDLPGLPDPFRTTLRMNGRSSAR